MLFLLLFLKVSLLFALIHTTHLLLPTVFWSILLHSYLLEQLYLLLILVSVCHFLLHPKLLEDFHSLFVFLHKILLLNLVHCFQDFLLHLIQIPNRESRILKLLKIHLNLLLLKEALVQHLTSRPTYYLFHLLHLINSSSLLMPPYLMINPLLVLNIQYSFLLFPIYK